MTVTCNQTRPSRTDRPNCLPQLFTKDTLIWEQIGMHRRMVRKMFPNNQFRNNMFHSQRGTRNKRILHYQFWNKMFHSQIENRNKTVLNLVINLQFGNKLFHSQRGPRNKTVLIYQFRNNVCHAKIGTRNKQS